MKPRLIPDDFKLENYLSVPEVFQGQNLDSELAQVEDTQVIPLLGNALFQDLIRIKNKGLLSGNKALLVRFLLRWMSHLALRQALPAFYLGNSSTQESYQKRFAFSQTLRCKALRMEREIKRFLRANTAEFPLWQPPETDFNTFKL